MLHHCLATSPNFIAAQACSDAMQSLAIADLPRALAYAGALAALAIAARILSRYI